MEIKQAEIKKDKIKKSARRVQGNELIAEYYKVLNEETGLAENRAEAVANCLKVWDIDYYRMQKVKDVLRVNLCRDKFCPNCQNLTSKRRYLKYKPELEKLLADNSLYHVVFSVPNCSGIELNETLKKMYCKFVYVVQYLQGKRKSKEIDFLQYGFKGAIRSLEITIHETGIERFEFHPHFHCVFVLRKGIKEERKYINDFSFKKGSEKKRLFNDFEILLQKSWFLFYNDKKLTKQGLDDLKQGYSVYAERVFNNFKEVFKYACKGLYDERTGSFNYSQEVFNDLYKGLHRRKIIQGYGILNKFKFDDAEEKEEFDEIYQAIIQELKQLEEPLRDYMRLNEILEEIEKREDITYISKNTVKGSLEKNEI